MSNTDNFSINFSGITHDHANLGPSSGCERENAADAGRCSTIAILRRHPMYDCLVLVKKFRACINGHALEFPTDRLAEHEQQLAADGAHCRNRRLVSRFLDGDDPMGCAPTAQIPAPAEPAALSQALPLNPFEVQTDDRGETCELVHVPINGLLDRLEGYTRQGLAVDSRVYAFAMGLKTSERILTTNSMKELQETPI